ncbi:hypothetical protein F4859DRAFT_227141 [Xylaria cf. heliscus]|nr:hypothetical protein F4859DRAFT_227141 [Xylaria cf. heliscus]
MEDLAKVQHLALDYTGNITMDMLHLFRKVVKHMPDLCTVRFVLPTVHMDLCDGLNRPLLPHRRCLLRPLEDQKLEQAMTHSRERQRQRDMRYTFPSHYPLAGLPGMPPVPHADAVRDMLERAVKFGAQQFTISFGVSLITEFCYSPSGDSRFVAAGEVFPDSPDPSVFATLNCPTPPQQTK